jgi:hypothetical protein
MSPPNCNSAPKGLRGWWASPTRSGMRRIIIPWEYRHLGFWARVRIGAGIVMVGLGVVTLSFGGNDWPTYGWTAFWLVLAAAQFSVAYWYLTIARSGSARA